MQKMYQISGITCPACVKIISKNILELEDVKSARIDINGNAEIESEKEISVAKLNNLLEKDGFKIVK